MSALVSEADTKNRTGAADNCPESSRTNVRRKLFDPKACDAVMPNACSGPRSVMSTTDELEKPSPLPAGTAPRISVMSLMFSRSNKSAPPLPLAKAGSPAIGRPLTVRPTCVPLLPRTRKLIRLPRP